jgi:NADPH-dependent 2,4-dienoyl-CoA reductase/sulfur reductase-like enzyme
MKRHDVLILGGGPAGLSAAQRLGELGHRDVVIVEREAVTGGVPRHCGHTAFGLREFHRLMSGPAYAMRLSAAASATGVHRRTTVTALAPGGEVDIIDPETGPSRIAGRAVLVAFGVRETPRSTRLVSGDRPWGVTTTGALQQFVYIERRKPFECAVVIGSELVSFSALLTLRHAGIACAGMIEASPRITARRPADWFARMMLGVPVMTSTALVAIHGKTKVEAVEIEQAGKRRRIDCDGVVFTGQFRPETAVLATSHLAIDSGTGGPMIDQYWRASDPAYFAAGNLLRPVETAGVAFAEGRAVAESIAAALAGKLPEAGRMIALNAPAPLAYFYPQRITLPLGPVSPLLMKARIQRRTKGRLRLLANGRELWSRSMTALPERRLSVPVDRLPRGEVEDIAVDFIED